MLQMYRMSSRLQEQVLEGYFLDRNAIKRDLFSLRDEKLSGGKVPPLVLGTHPSGRSVGGQYSTKTVGYYPKVMNEKILNIKKGLQGSGSDAKVLFSMTHLAKDTNIGSYTFNKTNSHIMPPGQALPGELLLARKRLEVSDVDQVRKNIDYIDEVARESKKIGDALISSYSEANSSSYTIDIARIGAYGKVTNFNHLRTCLANRLGTNNTLSAIVSDFTDAKERFATYEQYPYDWDPVGNFTKSFLPCGLFLNEVDGYAANSGAATYRVAIATAGNPNYAGEMAARAAFCYAPSDNYGLTIPVDSFRDLDKDGLMTKGVEFYIYILVMRADNIDGIHLYIVKSRMTEEYIKDASIEQINGSRGYLTYQTQIMENIGRHTQSCQGGLESAIKKKDFGTIHTPMYSSVFRLGYVPSGPQNKPPYVMFQHPLTGENMYTFPRFIVDLSYSWM